MELTGYLPAVHFLTDNFSLRITADRSLVNVKKGMLLIDGKLFLVAVFNEEVSIFTACDSKNVDIKINEIPKANKRENQH